MAPRKAAKKPTKGPAAEKCEAAATGKRVRAGLSKAGLPACYAKCITNLESPVRSAQLEAAVAVNRELIQFYWDVGRFPTIEQMRKN